MQHITKAELISELQKLEDRDGRITPKVVVDAARDPAHPLHDAFIWDDSIAGELHREDTARKLLSVRMKVRHHTRFLAVPTYVRDPSVSASDQGMRSTLRIRSDPESAREAVINEMVRITAILARAKDLAIVLGREEDVAKIEETVERFVATLDDDPDDRPAAS